MNDKKVMASSSLKKHTKGQMKKIALASTFTMLTIVFLSVAFFIIGANAIIDNRRTTVNAIMEGLSAITIAAIDENNLDRISEYMSRIDSLYSGFVVKYTRENVNSVSVISGGKVISVYSNKGLGKILPVNQFQELREVTSFTEIVTNYVNTFSLSEEKDDALLFYEYRVPLRRKVILSSGTTDTIEEGVLVLRFLASSIYKRYIIPASLSLLSLIGALIIVAKLTLLSVSLAKQLEETVHQVHHLSVTDELTGIYNRKRLNEALKQETDRARRFGSSLSLIMFDIDHFKKINDTYGHDVGDMVLKKLVETVAPLVRDTDLFARWGGEEFMILASETDRKGGRTFASRVRAKIAGTSFEPVKSVTSSFGVTDFSPEKDDIESLLKRVDEALYAAKESGRNCVRLG